MTGFVTPATPAPATAAADAPSAPVLERVLVAKDAKERAIIAALPEVAREPVEVTETENPLPPQEKTDTTFNGEKDENPQQPE